MAAACIDNRELGFIRPGTATLSVQDSNTKHGENALFLASGGQFCISQYQQDMVWAGTSGAGSELYN